MGFVKCTVTFLFRALFVVALVGLGVRHFLDINNNIPNVQKNLKLAESKLPKNEFLTKGFEKSHTMVFEILNVHAGLLILTGLLALFRFKLCKVTMFVFVVLELALNNNYLLVRDERYLQNTLKYVSLFASVLYI